MKMHEDSPIQAKERNCQRKQTCRHLDLRPTVSRRVKSYSSPQTKVSVMAAERMNDDL